MNNYLLHGKLKAQMDKGDELAVILVQASKLVSNAQGCRLYLVSKDTSDKDTVWVTEVWDSKADHDDSLNYPGVKELIARAIPLLEGPPQKGQELEVVGGLD